MMKHLLGAVAAAALFALSVPAEAEDAPQLCSFEFSAYYGEAWRERAAARSVYFALRPQEGKNPLLVLLCDGQVQDNFAGEADAEFAAGLSAAVRDLNLDSWQGHGSERTYSGEPEWGLSLVYQDGRTVTAGGRLGAGEPENFASAASAIRALFRENALKLRERSPRRLESFAFEFAAGSDTSKVCGIHMSQNQRSIMLMLNSDGGSSENFYIDEAAWREFEELLDAYPLAAWHGFSGLHPDGDAHEAFRLHVKYDTMETVEAEGSLAPPGSMPEGFRAFASAVADYFEKYRRMYEASEGDRRNDFREFFFSFSDPNGGRSGSFQINRVLTPGGMRFHLISEQSGRSPLACETLLAEDDVEGLESLCQRLELKEWNRFRGVKRGKPDAGFMLSLTFGGNHATAYGRGKFPDGYAEKSAELIGYLDAMEDRRAGSRAPE